LTVRSTACSECPDGQYSAAGVAACSECAAGADG
jgi:hypothetical protein